MREILSQISLELEIFFSRFSIFSTAENIPCDQRRNVRDYLEFARQYLELKDPVGAHNALGNARGEARDLGCKSV